jgi:hypothetical protein
MQNLRHLARVSTGLSYLMISIVKKTGVNRVEERKLDGCAQVEAAPVASGIGRDVVAGHVGGDESGARVMCADRRVGQRALSAGPDAAPAVLTRSGMRSGRGRRPPPASGVSPGTGSLRFHSRTTS